MINSEYSINFANWLNDSYEPCGKRQWKIRYPKNSQEMKECFTTEYLFDEYIKKWWNKSTTLSG